MQRMRDGPTDRSRVDLSDALSVRWWCRELRVTPGQLRMLVAEVGPRAEALREQARRTSLAAAESTAAASSRLNPDCRASQGADRTWSERRGSQWLT